MGLFTKDMNFVLYDTFQQKLGLMPWRHGGVVAVSGNGAKDRGFESRQGVRLLGLEHCNAILL
jgi:hypothetical protein